MIKANKTKAAVLYLLNDCKKTVLTYYLVITVVFVALLTVLASSQGAKVSGLMMITAIFLFIVGLNTFKENFGMLLQNGVSRKTILKSTSILFAILSIITAVADTVFIAITGSLANIFYYDNPFKGFNILVVQMLFPEVLTQHGYAFALVAEGVLSVFMSFFALALGYAITLLFYSLNKVGKIAVSVGVPVGLQVFSMLDGSLCNGAISLWIANVYIHAFGIKAQNPLWAMLTLFILAALLLLACFMMIRKAVIKGN